MYTFRDVRVHPSRREEYAFKLLQLYAFKLLQLQDSPGGAIVQPSPQAVMLYLNGLDLDVDDAEEALAVVLQRQLQDRRFEAAGRTAAQAERVSVAMSAALSEILGVPSRTGIVLTTQAGSVFSVRMSELRSTGMPPADKLVAGLVLLGIAA